MNNDKENQTTEEEESERVLVMEQGIYEEDGLEKESYKPVN